jgi:hypothetical protein
MSRREVIKCDRCGKEDTPGSVGVCVQLECHPCPAGGPSLPQAAEVDLCPACLAVAFRAAVELLDMGARSRLLARITPRGKTQ